MENDQIKKLVAELARLKEEIKLAAEKLPELPVELSEAARAMLRRQGLAAHTMIPLETTRELLRWVSKRLDEPLGRAQELQESFPQQLAGFCSVLIPPSPLGGASRCIGALRRAMNLALFLTKEIRGGTFWIRAVKRSLGVAAEVVHQRF